MQAYPLKSFAFMELAALTVLVLLGFCYVENAGVFSRHMIIHIALMTVAAPVLASLLLKLKYLSAKSTDVSTLFAAITLQAALLFAWHSPLGVGLAMKGHAGTLLMQATLFFSALWFWLTVFNQTGRTFMASSYCAVVDRQAVLLNCRIADICASCALRHDGLCQLNSPISSWPDCLWLLFARLLTCLLRLCLISRWFQTLSDTQSNVTSTAVAAENSS